MRKFLIKFLIFFGVFLGSAAFYNFYVVKEMSGGMGRLGKIPFGSEYEGLDVPWYERSGVDGARVTDVCEPEKLKSYNVITIGDSFSQMEEFGYSWKLSVLLHDSIANFPRSKGNPMQGAIELINSGMITEGQTLIVESVERSIIERLSLIDTTRVWCPAPPSVGGDEIRPQFLEEYFSWIRLKFGYDNPIHVFKMTRNCFENLRFTKNRVYVYSADIDGDFLYQNITEEQFKYAVDCARVFIDFAKSKGVNVYVLIATDKYDTYEPWIDEEHSKNPTLEYFKGMERVYDPKEDLQKAIGNGTLEIFRHNNSHWSVIGADVVAEGLAEYMESNP